MGRQAKRKIIGNDRREKINTFQSKVNVAHRLSLDKPIFSIRDSGFLFFGRS